MFLQSFSKEVIVIIDILNFFFCSHVWCWVKQFQWFEVNQGGAAISETKY